jgi:hypothetical protein
MNIQNYYDDFKNGRISQDKLKEKILEFSYNQMIKHPNIEAGEFILEMIPNVKKIITEYNEDKSTFYTYICHHIKWLSLQCAKKYLKERDKVEAYLYHHDTIYEDSMGVMDNEEEYFLLEKNINSLSLKETLKNDSTLKKRLTILVFKNSRLLNDRMITIASEVLGVKEEWIANIKHELDIICLKRLRARNYLEQRINRLLLDITKSQIILTNTQGLLEKQKLVLNIEGKMERLHRLQIILKKRNYGPKNEEISRVLNIPKGTIDSSLYYIKKNINIIK